MQNSCDIIVIGASAGGVEALRQLVGGLPPDFPGTIFIVLHRPAWGDSLLASILNRVGSLPAEDAQDGTLWKPGHIYIAPPDRHLLLDGPRLCLTRGPKENFSRPAIDPLFRSAARQFGPRVAGVVLTGTLYDGTGGLYAIKQAGGMALVQHPDDAQFAGMPRSALNTVDVDFVLPIGEIAPTLERLARAADTPDLKADPEGAAMSVPSPTPAPPPSTEFDNLPATIQQNQDEQAGGARHGQTSLFTCPDCGGTLWQADAGRVTQFRCHVGHAFTGEALADSQNQAIEHSLWYAIRTLTDRSLLLHQLANRSRATGDTLTAARFEQQAQAAEQHRETLRRIVEKDG